MTRLFVAFALVVTLTGATASAQPPVTLDGNFWVNLEANAGASAAVGLKALYVRGLLDGANLLGPILLLTAEAATPASAKASTDYYIQLQPYVKGVTAGQVLDGLDTLYKDFRNRKITLPVAAQVVLEQIAGVSNDAIEKKLQRLRAEASQ